MQRCGQGHGADQVGREVAKEPDVFQGSRTDNVDWGQHRNFGIRDYLISGCRAENT